MNGNSTATPFDPAPPGRFQQVYDSSIFGSLGESGGGFIAAISFRIDAFQGHSFTATIPNIQINLSTTSLFPDQLSSVFSQNVGPDDMVVLGPGAVPQSGIGGGGVTGFNVDFSFSTPFFYDPANGNLLLDIRIHQGFGPIGPPQGVAILDAFSVAGDSVSSVYAFGGSLPVSGQVSTLGLATDIVIIPVPEPSSIALLAVGMGMLGLGWKRMRKHVTGSSEFRVPGSEFADAVRILWGGAKLLTSRLTRTPSDGSRGRSPHRPTRNSEPGARNSARKPASTLQRFNDLTF